eukprot:9088644-Ditylum_brightwellii.AAC.1
MGCTSSPSSKTIPSKKITPGSNKLTPNVPKSPITKKELFGKIKKRPNSLFTKCLGQGVLVAWASKPNRLEAMPYMWGFLQKMRHDHAYSTRLGVFGVFPQCHHDGFNEEIPQAPSDERYPYFCIIKVHAQVESNTLAEAKAFGKILEKEFNQ